MPRRRSLPRGSYIASNGYLKIKVGRQHPDADGNGYVYAHLLVWLNAGGRRPKPHELIDHIDEDKLNNLPTNLRLKTRSWHSRHHVATQRRDRAGKFARRAA